MFRANQIITIFLKYKLNMFFTQRMAIGILKYNTTLLCKDYSSPNVSSVLFTYYTYILILDIIVFFRRKCPNKSRSLGPVEKSNIEMNMLDKFRTRFAWSHSLQIFFGGGEFLNSVFLECLKIDYF